MRLRCIHGKSGKHLYLYNCRTDWENIHRWIAPLRLWFVCVRLLRDLPTTAIFSHPPSFDACVFFEALHNIHSFTHRQALWYRFTTAKASAWIEVKNLLQLFFHQRERDKQTPVPGVFVQGFSFETRAPFCFHCKNIILNHFNLGKAFCWGKLEANLSDDFSK